MAEPKLAGRPTIPMLAATKRSGLGERSRSQHRHRLGPYLCWAVVFADIGTSVYYTPGILFGTRGIGLHAALFVGLTTIVFLLLAVKYAEVTIRYPEGGGVVTVGTRALHPFVGLLGGMFILVDYFLTAALSAVSGIGYLSFVFPALANNLTIGLVAITALLLLGLLNWVGIKESAGVSATFATIAFLSQVAVIAGVLLHLGVGDVFGQIPRVMSGPRLGLYTLLTGYAGAFLAFSGLESISQLSPVMAEPRTRVARLAMGAVVATIGLTSPLLTLMTTTLLDAHTIAANASSNALLSLLSDAITGRWLGLEVAISGSILLLFACNTALIGSYHVFLALSRMRFFPEILERRNRLRGTPHFAILLAVGMPVLILIPASLSPDTQTILGDLYAFGLLGAFSVTCLSLDVVRWRERHDHVQTARSWPLTILFTIGVLTTVLVVAAWSVNVVNKPHATLFGGTVTAIGLAIAAVNYVRLSRQGLAVAFPRAVRAALPESVMVMVPATSDLNELAQLVELAQSAADGKPVVFVYRGAKGIAPHDPRLFEVADPYLYDRAAQDTLGRVERQARRLKLDRRYVYVPANGEVDAVTRLWQTVRPRDTLVTAGDEEALCELAADRVRRTAGKGVPVLHYLKHW